MVPRCFDTVYKAVSLIFSQLLIPRIAVPLHDSNLQCSGRIMFRSAFAFLAIMLFHYADAWTKSLPFKATYSGMPTPFKIDVDKAFIEETVHRVKLTRFPVDIDQPDLLDGPPVHNATTVRDYWLEEYDWFAIQAEMNKQ